MVCHDDDIEHNEKNKTKGEATEKPAWPASWVSVWRFLPTFRTCFILRSSDRPLVFKQNNNKKTNS
jgi:hypothetical protein